MQTILNDDDHRDILIFDAPIYKEKISVISEDELTEFDII